jgi:rhamnosyltransferase
MLDKTLQVAQICAVCVTYNPGPEFTSLIEWTAEYLPETLIVDNNSATQGSMMVEKTVEMKHWALIRNPQNLGLAAALNQAAAWAYAHDYAAMLVFDQDSTIVDNVIDALISVCAHFTVADRVAIMGSNFHDRRSGRLFAESGEHPIHSFRETHAVFNTGSLVSVSCHRELGGYREDFFVDLIDAEFCARAQRKGYKVIQSYQPTMIHSVGDPKPHQFGRRRVWALHHKPWRYFYLMRNSVIMLRSFPPKTPSAAFATLAHTASWALKAVCFEEARTAKLWNISTGFVAGLRASRSRI